MSLRISGILSVRVAGPLSTARATRNPAAFRPDGVANRLARPRQLTAGRIRLKCPVSKRGYFHERREADERDPPDPGARPAQVLARGLQAPLSRQGLLRHPLQAVAARRDRRPQVALQDLLEGGL